MKNIFNKKRGETSKLFDFMYETAKDNGFVHTKEEFAKILEKPIVDSEIDKILKPIENKDQEGLMKFKIWKTTKWNDIFWTAVCWIILGIAIVFIIPLTSLAIHEPTFNHILSPILLAVLIILDIYELNPKHQESDDKKVK